MSRIKSKNNIKKREPVIPEPLRIAPKPQKPQLIEVMLSPKRLIAPGGYPLDLVTKPGKKPRGDIRVMRSGDVWTVDPTHPTIVRFLASGLLIRV